MLRKKYHVVRKKNHVVRKLFYVASIFGGAAGRKNRPPWELSSTAGSFFSTAARAAGLAIGERGCYVKKFTYDVILFTYDVIFVT